jgi:hypothetical protein
MVSTYILQNTAAVQQFAFNAGTCVPGDPLVLPPGSVVMCSDLYVTLIGSDLTISPNAVMLIVDAPGLPPYTPSIFTDTAIPVDLGGGKPDED